MSDKAIKLSQAKTLYDDLRERVESVDNQVVVSDTEPQEVSNKLWIDTEEGQEFTIPTYQEFSQLSVAIDVSQPTAQNSDIGKFLKLKTIDQDGKPTEFEYGEGGGGSVDPSDIEAAVDDWLEENITNPDSPPLDRSLSSASSAAPADIVGELDQVLTQIAGIPEETFSDLSSLEEYHGWINNSNNWNNTGSTSAYQCKIIPLEDKSGTVTFTVDAQSPIGLRYAFLSQYSTPVDGSSANVISKSDIGVGNSRTLTIPDTAKAVYCATVNNNKTTIFSVLVDYPGTPGRIDEIESDITELQGLESKIELNVANQWIPNSDNDSGNQNVYTSSQSEVTLVKAASTMSDYLNHILYVRGELKTNKDASIKAILNQDRETTSVTADTWTVISGEGSYLATNNGAGFVASIASGTGLTMYYKHVVLIDVTALYGAGNEPPKETLDLIFNNASPESWSTETINVFSTAILKMSAVRNLGSGLGVITESQHVILSPDGNVQISSIANQNWSGWTDIGSYGQNRPTVIPIYNKVHGTLETDGMMSVIPLWGAWSNNASTTGNAYHGGHVFHGWTTDRMHRVTLVQNIYREDEAALFNYIPGDKSATNEGIFLRLRLGADNIGKGILIENIYEHPGGEGGSYGSYKFARLYVFGRLNIQNSPAGSIDSAGTGTGASLPSNNVPASANAPGVKGDFTFDSNYAYFCTATDTWKRVPLQSWA